MLRSEWIGVIFLNRKNSMYIHDQLFTVTMYILYTVKLEIMTAVCISVSLHFEEMVRYLVNLFFITKGYLKAVLFVHTNQKKNTPGNWIVYKSHTKNFWVSKIYFWHMKSKIFIISVSLQSNLKFHEINHSKESRDGNKW